MTTKQGVTIVSRVLTVYFLTLAAYRLSDIPVALMAFFHYQNTYGGDYYYRVRVESLAHSVLLIALDLAVALMFYRCGGKVAAFLTGETGEHGQERGLHEHPPSDS